MKKMSMQTKDNRIETSAVKISVIIPLYNAEKTLKRCLESVLKQTLHEIEIICVNDRSTDKSGSILVEYKNKDKRIIVLENEINLRAGISRNRGIEIAKGKYCFFLDADDYMIETALETMFLKAEKFGADVLRARTYAIDSCTGELVKNKRYEMSEVPIDKMNCSLSFKENEDLLLKELTVAPWGGIIKTEYVKENKLTFNNLMCVNDRSFFIHSVMHTNRIFLIDDFILYHTTNNADSLIARRMDNYSCHIESYKIIKKIVKNESEEVKAAIYQSEIRDMLSWFNKFKDTNLEAVYVPTKNFLTVVKDDIELIKKHSDNYISQPWYMTYRKIVENSKEEFSYRYTAGFDFDLKTPEMIKTYNKVKIHNLINFNQIAGEKIKVSVIVPVCNVEMYLRECIESIINQTLKEIEIICVNDGSKDNSLEILKEFAQLDSRVKIIHKDNAGYGHTMNIGMDMAKGEFIGIVESDDYILPTMYEDLYKIAKENKVDFVKADFNRFMNKKGKIEEKLFKICGKASDYNRVIRPYNYLYAFGFVKNTWSGIYSTEFLRRNNIRHNETPGASFQDNGFWFKTFAEAETCYFVDTPYYMNRRDNPNSSVYNQNKVYCMFEEYKYIREYLESSMWLLERYKYVFQAKKYVAYKFTLELVRMKDKRKVLGLMQKEFIDAEAKGELNPAYFAPKEWNTLQHIMRDPDDFFFSVVKKSVKVSVILPVYNTSEFLRKCIESFLSQSLEEIEIICINDGSTDDSWEILNEYALIDRRVKCINQENQGAGFARNVGIELAVGEYLYFPDADDYVDKNLLKKAYNRIVTREAEICVFGAKLFDSKTGTIKSCDYAMKKEYLPNKQVFSMDDVKGSPFTCFMGWAWDKLYSSNFVRNHALKFQNQRTTNDMYFVFASLLKAERITILDEKLYFQRRNNPNSLSSTRELSWTCFYSALLQVKNELVRMGIFDKRKKDFINYALHSCLWNLNTLSQPVALELFKKLKGEWLESLEIKDYGEVYYDNKEDYYQLVSILNSLDEESSIESVAYCSYRIKVLEKENERLKSDSKLIKVSSTESLTETQLIEKLKWNRRQRGLLEDKVKELEKKLENKVVKDSDLLQTENSKLKKQNEELLYNLSEIRKSFSYKVGMFITFIPRKIRAYLNRKK